MRLSELGPAFIKFGQVLSTRSDLLGEEVAADLAKLQDQLPHFSAFEARSTIERELGAPIDLLYLQFDDVPVSAARSARCISRSRCRSRSIRRPRGRGQGAAADIELAFAATSICCSGSPSHRAHPTQVRRLKPVEVVKTFAATVRVEMDLRLEAASASELARISPAIPLPRAGDRLEPHRAPGDDPAAPLRHSLRRRSGDARGGSMSTRSWQGGGGLLPPGVSATAISTATSIRGT
jgi:hypothetical protein